MTTREEITKDAKVGRYDEYDKGEVIDEIEQDFHNDQSDMALVNDHIENMVDTTTKYFEGDTFEEPTEEDLIQSAVKYDQNKPNRPYQSESCKPIFTAGKISIGLSHAKLFGLLDENGNICVKPQGMSVQEKMKTIKKAKELAQPKENPVVVMLPEDEDPSLKIRREERQKRLQAMKNPRLGYDFLGKDRGNILERVTAPAKSKKADKFAELDYDAKLDKLACPKCKREQSYDEYSEKKRVCGQCGIRFAQLHISNILAFEGRLKVKIQKAQQRKDAVEAEMYPTPKLNLTSLTSSVSRPTSPWSTGRASIGSSRAFDSARGDATARSDGAMTNRSTLTVNSTRSPTGGNDVGGGGSGSSSGSGSRSGKLPIIGIKTAGASLNSVVGRGGGSTQNKTSPAEIFRGLAEQQAQFTEGMRNVLQGAGKRSTGDLRADKFKQLLEPQPPGYYP